MAKRLWLTIVLAVLIYGLGHMYLGFLGRGIAILVFGIFISIAMPILIPVLYSWMIIIGYSLWQIWDVYKHYKKLNPGKPQIFR